MRCGWELYVWAVRVAELMDLCWRGFDAKRGG